MVKETAKELAKLRKIFDPIVITPSKTLARVYDIGTFLDVYPDAKLEKVFGMYELRKEMKRITNTFRRRYQKLRLGQAFSIHFWSAALSAASGRA